MVAERMGLLTTDDDRRAPLSARRCGMSATTCAKNSDSLSGPRQRVPGRTGRDLPNRRERRPQSRVGKAVAVVARLSRAAAGWLPWRLDGVWGCADLVRWQGRCSSAGTANGSGWRASCVATLDRPRRLWLPATPASASRGCLPRSRVPSRTWPSWGSCLPMSESLPYGAITDAFDHLTGPAGRPVLDKALSRCAPFVAPQIAALIPAMSAEAHPSANVTADRTRLFTAVRDLLAALGAARRTALVVEDLHWADAGTLDLLTFLVRGPPPGTALLATSRRDKLQADKPGWSGSPPRRASRRREVTLAPLPRGDIADLVASLVDGAPTAGFVADVVRRGEGSPFFTEQLVAAARDVAPPLEARAGVPPGVAQMLLGRVRSVGAAGTEVSAALAVAARPLTEPGGSVRRHQRGRGRRAAGAAREPPGGDRRARQVPAATRLARRHRPRNPARIPARRSARRRRGRIRRPDR